MMYLAFRCHDCFQTSSAERGLGIDNLGAIRCPHCGATYVYSRLRGSRDGGFHKPYSVKALVIFPHSFSEEELACQLRLIEIRLEKECDG